MVSAADDDLGRAQACAKAMWSTDHTSQAMGMQILQIAPGFAKLTMTIRQDMVNGHSICHGGFIATLADSTFAFACNTYDVVTVASGFSIDFIEPGQLGDVLVAEGREITVRGRSGIYDVTVCRDDPQRTVIAQFRGRSRSLGRPILT